MVDTNDDLTLLGESCHRSVGLRCVVAGNYAPSTSPAANKAILPSLALQAIGWPGHRPSFKGNHAGALQSSILTR